MQKLRNRLTMLETRQIMTPAEVEELTATLLIAIQHHAPEHLDSLTREFALHMTSAFSRYAILNQERMVEFSDILTAAMIRTIGVEGRRHIRKELSHQETSRC